MASVALAPSRAYSGSLFLEPYDDTSGSCCNSMLGRWPVRRWFRVLWCLLTLLCLGALPWIMVEFSKAHFSVAYQAGPGHSPQYAAVIAMLPTRDCPACRAAPYKYLSSL